MQLLLSFIFVLIIVAFNLLLSWQGHKSYVPNMISGASQADIGVLVSMSLLLLRYNTCYCDPGEVNSMFFFFLGDICSER